MWFQQFVCIKTVSKSWLHFQILLIIHFPFLSSPASMSFPALGILFLGILLRPLLAILVLCTDLLPSISLLLMPSPFTINLTQSLFTGIPWRTDGASLQWVLSRKYGTSKDTIFYLNDILKITTSRSSSHFRRMLNTAFVALLHTIAFASRSIEPAETHTSVSNRNN